MATGHAEKTACRGTLRQGLGVKNDAKDRVMSWMVDGVGRFLAHYLEKPVQGYEPFTPSDAEALRATLRTGDVLLVEGNNHISLSLIHI